MRLFVALQLPEAVRRSLWRATRPLRETEAPIRWVPPEAFHLTLKFLGEVEEERRDGIVAALRRVAAGRSPLQLRLEGVGGFPNLRRPRVVWLGARSEDLGELQAGIEEAMVALGFDREERPFHPHVTLGRVRRRAGPGSLARLDAAASTVDYRASCEVATVDLMRSQLRPDGARYEAVEIVSLGGRARVAPDGEGG